MKQLILALLLLFPAVASANEVQMLTSSKGISAWLIEDHHLPIVSLAFAWRGGVEQDEIPQEGLTHLAADMLTKGAGKDDENAFQKKLQENAIALDFSAHRDTIYGQMRAIKETLPTAMTLLHDSLTSPRFDEQSLARLKDQTISQIKQYQSDPEWKLSRVMMSKVFEGHPYSKRSLGTAKTIADIKPADLKTWHRRLGREGLMVAITGDLTKGEAVDFLDKVFGDLPEHSVSMPLADAKPSQNQVILVDYKGPQSSMMLVLPGIPRSDKDWYALEVMNYIFGGGSFSSRLMDEIREKRGLTYGISSGMELFDHAALYSIQASFKNENAGQVYSLVKDEMARLRDKPVSEIELKAAKDYLIGAYGLGLTSTSRVAQHYLEIQRQKLNVDDQKDHEKGINAVTADDVQRVAKRILRDDLIAAFFVGEPKGISASSDIKNVE